MPEVLGDVGELVAVIRRTAQQEALNIAAESERQAQAILGKATAQADQIRTSALAQAQSRADQESRRLLARAALAAQRERLQAREELLARIWQSSEQELRALTAQPEYEHVLHRLALAAARSLAAGAVVLAADPVGHALLAPARLAAWSSAAEVQFRRAAEPAATWGGLIASDDGGRRQIDATFPTRLALAQEELRERVAELLEVT